MGWGCKRPPAVLRRRLPNETFLDRRCSMASTIARPQRGSLNSNLMVLQSSAAYCLHKTDGERCNDRIVEDLGVITHVGSTNWLAECNPASVWPIRAECRRALSQEGEPGHSAWWQGLRHSDRSSRKRRWGCRESRTDRKGMARRNGRGRQSPRPSVGAAQGT